MKKFLVVVTSNVAGDAPMVWDNYKFNGTAAELKADFEKTCKPPIDSNSYGHYVFVYEKYEK